MMRASLRPRRPSLGPGRSVARLIGDHLLGAVTAVVFLVPLVLVLLNSLKSDAESSVLTLDLPKEWRWDNYVTVLTAGKTAGYLLNSVIITVGVTAVTILVCGLAAFVIARRPGRLSSGVYSYLLAGLIAPFAVIPAIRLLQYLHLYGTFPGLILIDVAVQIPFITFIYVGFLRQLPTELDEAAIIDGAGPFTLFFRIIFPLLRPVTSTAVVLLFTFAWNEFQNVLYLMPDSRNWTMPMSVYDFNSTHTTNYALVCADLVITMVPMFIVYLTAQKYIVSGMTAGAVKS